MVNATAWGSLMRRIPKDAYRLLDDMTLDAFSWNSDRLARRPFWVYSLNTQAAQVEALQRQLNQMNASQHQMVSYEFYGGNHDNMDCQVSASFEKVNFMGNFQRGQNIFQRPIQNQFQNRGQDRSKDQTP